MQSCGILVFVFDRTRETPSKVKRNYMRSHPTRMLQNM